MRRSTTLVLCLLGLFDSLYLLYTYTSPSRPMVCIGTGCDAVRASAYSNVGGVPMPAFGVLGYTLLSIVTLAESLSSARIARLARYAFLGMTGFGFLVSLYLEYLQAFVIHAYCAWCVTSGVVMSALFVLAIVNLVRSGPEPEPAMQLARLRGLFAVCVAGLLVGVPGFYLLARHSQLAPAVPQARPADLQTRLMRPGSHETGGPTAPLTVVEFGDFECPVCGRGEAAAREIRTLYGSRIRFAFRQFPLERIHALAEKAAEASECAGDQGKFWEMVEKIYARQDDLSIRGLERDAGELGLDKSRFSRCLTGGAMAGRVRQDIEDGRALGVRATPTFFIGQQRVEGVLTTAQFAQLIDNHLASAGQIAAGNAEPRSNPVAAPPQRPATKASAPRAPAPAVATKAAAPPAQLSMGFPGTGFGGSLGGPGGPAGLAGGGATCSEADAAKQQPTLIDTQQLRLLLAGNANPLFVDVRPPGEYAAGRIPGAVNLPADEIAQRWSTLPKDRTVILYEGGRSSGDICAASRAAGRTLIEYGFPSAQVKVYQDGLAGWDRAGIRTDK
jgi:protein-disulfide isomerase/uncharacterized membrane protein/rhodanese-related sulfurtransferase